MCGRFTLRATTPALIKQFELSFAVETTPRYNVAPTQQVAAIRLTTLDRPSSAPAVSSGRLSAPARELVWLRWGLIPSWADDPQIAARLINARGETVADRPAFRGAFRQRRCIVVADGYFEWKKEASGKQPYWIRRLDDQPMALAGLWESWSGAAAHRLYQPWETCTLITTSANESTRAIHDRMPVILSQPDWATWLDVTGATREQLLPLLRPNTDADLRVDRVSRRVNHARYDGPECVEIESGEG